MTTLDDISFSDAPDAPDAPDAAETLGRVLLVDDEPELRRIGRRHLTKAGFAVTEAANGRLALALVETGNFDIVVSDMRMPDMGGLELAERLSTEAPDLPVVLISGCSGFADADTARAYGVFDCLEKPVELQDLLDVVSLAVGIRRGFLRRAEVPRDSETRLAVGVAAPIAPVVPIRRRAAGE